MNDAADSADLAPAERLHPLMLLSGLGGSLRGVAGGYAGIGYLAATGRFETALVLGALLLAGALISLLIYWRRFTFRVGAHELRIDSGLFNRTHRSIPFDRVQDVDISQGPLQRLLGLASVTFDTGASGGSKDEGALNGIALDRAHTLRDHVRARRGAAAALRVEADGEATPLFAMDFRRVLTAGVFNFSLAIFAGLFGLTQTLGDVIGFDPFERRFWTDLLASAGPLSSFVQTHRIGAAVAGMVSLILVGLLTGVVRTVARDYRFRLDRAGTGLRRRRGLFTITDVTLPLRRVQAALILTGPVRERFGWRELKLQSLAQDEGGAGDHVVAPLATEAETAEVLAPLDWPLPHSDTGWQQIHPAHLWTFLIAWSPLLLLALLLMGGLGAVVAAAAEPARRSLAEGVAPAFLPLTLLVGAILLGAGSRWLAWKRSAWALDGEQLLVRTGWWRRRTLLLPFGSVQSADLTETALSRRFGIVDLVIGVAGGRGYSGHKVPALPREKASQVREALLSRFL